MLGPNESQVRMLQDLECGTYEGASAVVIRRNLSSGLVARTEDDGIEITQLGRQALDCLRSGEFAGTWLGGKKVYNYTASWRTDYPSVNWGVKVMRGRSVQPGPGGSFACKDLSQVPGAVRDLVESSIRELARAENRER